MPTKTITGKKKAKKKTSARKTSKAKKSSRTGKCSSCRKNKWLQTTDKCRACFLETTPYKPKKKAAATKAAAKAKTAKAKAKPAKVSPKKPAVKTLVKAGGNGTGGNGTTATASADQMRLLWESMEPAERLARLHRLQQKKADSLGKSAYSWFQTQLQGIGVNVQGAVLLYPNGKYEENPHPTEQVRELVRAMKHNGWKVADVARYMGVSDPCVSNWINKHTIPERATRAQLTRFMRSASNLLEKSPKSRIIFSDNGKLTLSD